MQFVKQLPMSKEYRDLLIANFRKRVYPLSLACAVIFIFFFFINVIMGGKPIFVVLDIVAAFVFAFIGIAVKREILNPLNASIFILSIMMLYFVLLIFHPSVVRGVVFYYGALPFFAYYMAGSRLGNYYGFSMIGALLTLWLASSFSWITISNTSVEMGMLTFLLSFSFVSAWVFESIREKTFNESYQSGLRHEILMQALNEVYYRVDMKGVIQEIGDAITTLTGYDPSEARGRLITSFYAEPKNRDAYVAALKKHGSVKNYPIEILGKQGQHVMISMSSRMFFDESGEPLYIEGLFRDVTKEREAERERTENLEHLRALSVVENALEEADLELSLQQVIEVLLPTFAVERAFLVPLCLGMKDPDGQCYDAVFIAESSVFSPFQGRDFIAEDEVKAYLASMPKQRKTSPMVMDDSNIFSVQLLQAYGINSQMMIVLQTKSKHNWLLGLHNFTNKEKAEQKKRLFVDVSRRIGGALNQLILQKDLEATVARVEIASIAKGEFVATMSHELRTPLHGVIGLLDLLGMEASNFSKEQQQTLALAQSSAHVLSALIDDVLDLSKIESGKIVMQKQPFNLQQAFTDALIPFVMKAREKHIDLNLEMKNVATVIEGDVLHLRQVLLNLVGNAVKFTHQGYVRIAVSQDDNYLQINIEDSGIGISHDQQDIVFNPFVQVHDVNVLGDNLQEKGTGLGTTIAQHFVNMMGGSLTLQSEPKVGSTMSIRLPLQQVGVDRVTLELQMFDLIHMPDKNFVDAEHVLQKKWRVLLAEDDPVGRRVVVKRLLRSGFNVETVVDGVEAWEKVQQQDFDLLLTDVRMPGLNGVQLTEAIRGFEQEKKKTPMMIIGLSAYALEDVKHNALTSGMDGFITKPVDMQALIHILESKFDDEASC